MKERVWYYDYLRIISVFSVIIIHTASRYIINLPVQDIRWMISNIFISTAKFCVPILFMISGAIFLDNKKDITFKNILFKNTKRILIAYLFWSFLYAVNRSIHIDDLSAIQMIKKIILGTLKGHYHMWFIKVLIGLYIIVPILRKISIDKNIALYFILLSFVFNCIMPIISKFNTLDIEIINQLDVNLVLGYSFYFMLGSYVSQMSVKKEDRKKLYILGLISLFITFIGTFLISKNNNTINEIFYDYFSINIAIYSLAIFVFFKYYVIYLQTSLNKLNYYNKYVYIISESCFGIYLVHEFFYSIFFIENINVFNLNIIFLIPIKSMVIFIISFITVYIIKKAPYISKYIT